MIDRDTIQQFVIKQITKKSRLQQTDDVESLDYMESGYVDSMGLITFIVEIEAEYDIRIDDEDIEKDGFRTVGGLITIIEDKLKEKEA